MKSLEPDVEEQALLAGISMFSPFLRNVRDHDDIHLLSKIQVSKKILDTKMSENFYVNFQYTLTKMLEKKLRRNPSRMIHFANFMLGISKLQTISSDSCQFVPSHGPQDSEPGPLFIPTLSSKTRLKIGANNKIFS